MKIVIAMDAWKGSLSAEQAGAAAAAGLKAALADATVRQMPMADGGEGTAGVVVAAYGGDWMTCEVTGPLPDRRVQARYGWIEDGPAAIVEMAAAAGLTLLDEAERDPLRTTTYGVGELLADAMRRGAQRLLLGVGGSATVDGGTGAARALGWQFLDGRDKPVVPGGGALQSIRRIVPPDGEDLPPLEILSDVTNPLCGQRGAAAVFGPQKGADAAGVKILSEGLDHLARLVREQLGIEIADLEGAGAAGGLAAGAVAFMNGRVVSGIERVMDLCGMDQALAEADWVLTGEGSCDEQSLHGKVIDGVAGRAKANACRTAVLAGRVGLDRETAKTHGIDYMRAATPPDMPLAQAVERAGSLLEAAAREFGLWIRRDAG